MENIFLKRLELKAFEEDSVFSKIEGLNKFNSLNFKKPITFFSGENGTGKSTLLEAIAVNWGFNPEGGSINFNFSTNDTHLDLHNYLTVGKSVKRAKDGFFLRAESFYNVATYAENIDLDFSEYGDKSLHHQSHGESFLNLVNHRFRGNGLYLFDEPEAALSPQRQLALMISIKKLIDEGSQFIIVSHSPILLAMPDSQIISFDKDSPLEITYEESMPYEITSLFLNNKNRILSHLFAE
ncbi:AAA family ATPase [Enterococcus faecalis]|nr:AAA family ATPase [Enterococcus faecalis]